MVVKKQKGFVTVTNECQTISVLKKILLQITKGLFGGERKAAWVKDCRIIKGILGYLKRSKQTQRGFNPFQVLTARLICNQHNQ